MTWPDGVEWEGDWPEPRRRGCVLPLLGLLLWSLAVFGLSAWLGLVLR